jgi:hypothetical protein
MMTEMTCKDDVWISWKCDRLLISLALLLVTLVATGSGEEQPPMQTPELLFNETTDILGSYVTCNNQSEGQLKFAKETWSCYDIRVNGSKLRSYFWTDADKASDSHCTDDVQGLNDHSAICQHLLTAHNITKQFVTTFIITDPLCTVTKDSRAMFVKVKPSAEQYHWILHPPGKGFVKTLRCMLQD